MSLKRHAGLLGRPMGPLSPPDPSGSPSSVTALTSALVEELAEAQREKKAQNRTIQSSKTKAMSFILWTLSSCWALLDFDSKKVSKNRTEKCQR